MDQASKVEEVVNALDKLPTLPGIAMKILEVVRDKEASLKQIADTISNDPSLSAEILKAINSPFYGLSKKVTSVHHAVNLLGISTIKSLALSFSLIKNFRNRESGEFDHTKYWKDSLIGAVSTKLIAEKVAPEFAEDCFFLGLLQNIGTLTLVNSMPKQYNLVMAEISNDGYQDHEAEKQIFGVDHMEVGAYLARSWGLPETFSAPIGYHHQPETLSTDDVDIQMYTRIVHLSSLIIELFNSREMSLSLGVLEHWTQKYAFTDKLNVCQLGSAINQKTQPLFALFDIEIKEEIDYDELINAAKIELANLSQDLINDLLQKRCEIESLRQQVDRDSMTQLNNHQRFKDLLDQEISRSERYNAPLSVIITDIDHFKSVNDTFGHPAGDKVIKTIADRLKQGLRESDHIARYGGEEFAIILTETALNDALLVAERLRESIESLKIIYEDQAINVTMSFGLAAFPVGGSISREELVKSADTALYEAKGQGRNRCCVCE